MSHCLCIGVLVAAADVGAWVLTAETGDSRWAAYIVSGTTVVISLCGAIIILAPHLAKALTAIAGSIYPALALIWKQNEEIRKGSLTGQLDDLKHLLTKAEADRAAATAAQAEASLKLAATNERIETLVEQNAKLQHAVEEDKARTEDANKKLHEIRKEFNIATLQHREQREALIAQLADQAAQLAAQTQSLEAAREEIAEFQRREAAGRARQDVKIEAATAAIVQTNAAVQEQAVAIERMKPDGTT